jgi:hypothetical protein
VEFETGVIGKIRIGRESDGVATTLYRLVYGDSRRRRGQFARGQIDEVQRLIRRNAFRLKRAYQDINLVGWKDFFIEADGQH